MNQLLLICAVVALGCGKATKEKAAKIKAAADARVAAEKKATETATIPQQPKTTSEKLITDPIVEKAVREKLKKPTGELTKADLEKVKYLDLDNNQLTDVKGLEKLTQLKILELSRNQLTNVKGLEKLTKLEWLALELNQLTSVKGLEKLTQLNRLNLRANPDLTKAQIAELQKALPNCRIWSNPKK